MVFLLLDGILSTENGDLATEAEAELLVDALMEGRAKVESVSGRLDTMQFDIHFWVED